MRGEIFLGGGDSATSNFVWFDKKSEILSGSPEDQKFCPVREKIRNFVRYAEISDLTVTWQWG